MITTAEEYQKYLWQLQDSNKPVSAILLPSDENIYEIDLNARTVNAPEFLSVRKDHAAETVYFLVDRFYDNMDLSQTTCIIEYINAAGEEKFFPVPFYDVTTFGNSVRNDFLLAAVTEQEYKINTYYIKDTQGNFALTENAYNPNEIYYIKTNPLYNTKYVKVDLDKSSYTPNSFYYMEYNTESKAFGQYTQDAGEFVQDRNYFAKIDSRYVQIALTADMYKRNKYYIINSKGNMEITTGSFNADYAYFEFVDSPKMLFPWVISGDVTKREGTVQFAIRFYVAEAKQINNNPVEFEYYNIYDLHTKPSSSKILYGMDGYSDIENDFEATTLEAIYSRLNALEEDYNLYWIEA